jgi:hypothetical protein
MAARAWGRANGSREVAKCLERTSRGGGRQ